MVDEINTKSNRNKFEALNKLIINNINIIMVFETKIDDTFPVSKPCVNGYFPRIALKGPQKGVDYYHISRKIFLLKQCK